MAGHGHGEHGDFRFRAKGLGGHIDVFRDRIEVVRHGVLHFLFEVLDLYEGSTHTVLPLASITGVSLIEPFFAPGYIRFSYAGSPEYTKHYWADAMKPNSLLMGYFDNRAFHRLKRVIEGVE